jgi:hypothetical protein
MKTRALLLAVILVQCKGSAAPAPTPGASSAPAAGQSGKGTDPGPSVGMPLPALEAPDQDGRTQTFETLRGPNGLLLNFNRSVLW